MPDLETWVLLPENRAAYAAVQAVAERVAGAMPRRAQHLLFLHGPPGCGKSHLVSGLVAEVTRKAAGSVVAVLPAQSFFQPERAGSDNDGAGEAPAAAARRADLVVVEDVQHLPVRAAESVAALVDHCVARGRQFVATATEGPGRLTHLPARLTSRLAAGLVIGILPLTPAGRAAFLGQCLARRGLTAPSDVVAWLVRHGSGSARQLEGAVARVETVARLRGRPPSLEDLVDIFREESAGRDLTVERIARHVGSYFQVALGSLKSRRRSRDALLPRQVGMYLARRLTGLSLGQIGAYFGGRDHTTVLHACRKVEEALNQDAGLNGVVRQLMAEVA